MLITHDLGVVAETAENVLVMYAGKVVEYADVKTLFKSPRHPYTVGLLGSIPRLDEKKEKLNVIEGIVPNPFEMPSGCRFHPRCKEAQEICFVREPEIVKEGNSLVRCWKYSNQWAGGVKAV
jgi:oligopeptide/dipeptide ABC transporter ATP-binding protein